MGPEFFKWPVVFKWSEWRDLRRLRQRHRDRAATRRRRVGQRRVLVTVGMMRGYGASDSRALLPVKPAGARASACHVWNTMVKPGGIPAGNVPASVSAPA